MELLYKSTLWGGIWDDSWAALRFGLASILDAGPRYKYSPQCYVSLKNVCLKTCLHLFRALLILVGIVQFIWTSKLCILYYKNKRCEWFDEIVIESLLRGTNLWRNICETSWPKICNGIFKNSFCIRWQCFKENCHGLKLIQVLPFSMCEFDCNHLHTAFVHFQCWGKLNPE